MEQLISYRNKRLLKIVESLVTKGEAQNIQSIRDMNACSLKTAYDDVKFLIDSDYNDSLKLKIENKHVYSEIRSMQYLIDLKQSLYQEEVSVQLLMNILMKPRQALLDHSVDLSYSYSYLNKQMKTIEAFLKQHGIKVIASSANAEYHFEAESELKLIITMAEFIKASGYDDLLPDIKSKLLDEVIEHLRVDANIEITDPWRKDLYRIYQVYYLRMEQGFDVPIMKDILHRIYEEILEHKETIYRKTIAFLDQNNLDANETDLGHIYGLFTMISIKAYFIPQPMTPFICRYQYFFDSFAKQDPRFAKNFEEHLLILEEEIGLRYSHYVWELFFHVYNSTKIRAYRELKIACFSDLGHEHEQSLVRFMDKHFPQHDCEPYEEGKKYDLIITTSLLEPKSHEKTDYISINDFPNHVDFKNIYQKIMYP